MDRPATRPTLHRDAHRVHLAGEVLSAPPPLRHRDQRARDTASLFALTVGCPDPQLVEELIEQVILLNIEVAETIALRYHRRGVDDEELDAVARMALVKAARRFDPELGHDFLTFAVPTVRGEVRCDGTSATAGGS